jgi:hypothetical protein
MGNDMGQRLSRHSRGSQPVPSAAPDLLVACGHAGPTLQEIQVRSRAAGVPSEQEDLEELVDHLVVGLERAPCAT